MSIPSSATTIRDAQKATIPAAIVISTGTRIDYCFMSDALKEFRGIDWIRKGSPPFPASLQLRYHATMHVVSVPPHLVFQALADGTRIRVLRVLATGGEEACLCELVDSLLEPQYKLSRHLKLLRQVGLLAAEKDGRFVYHKLVTHHRYLKTLYAAICALPDSEGVFATDFQRFARRMRLRQSGRCRVGIQTASLAVAQQDAAVKRSA